MRSIKEVIDGFGVTPEIRQHIDAGNTEVNVTLAELEVWFAAEGKLEAIRDICVNWQDGAPPQMIEEIHKAIFPERHLNLSVKVNQKEGTTGRLKVIDEFAEQVKLTPDQEKQLRGDVARITDTFEDQQKQIQSLTKERDELRERLAEQKQLYQQRGKRIRRHMDTLEQVREILDSSYSLRDIPGEQNLWNRVAGALDDMFPPKGEENEEGDK